MTVLGAKVDDIAILDATFQQSEDEDGEATRL